MRATILCPGPGLELFVPDGSRLIGVNRAVLAFACDWWAFGDWRTYMDHRASALGRPTAFTSVESREVIRRECGGDPIALTFADIKAPDPKAIDWRLFSATAAVALAAHLGATDITMVGAPMTDAPDWDGATGRYTRTERRWARERAILDALAEAIATTTRFNKPLSGQH